jgi:RNA polymerase sigma factor (TIGR02999 family)
MSDVTRILEAIDAGDPQAANQLLPLVYDELRKLAAAKLAHEKPGQTLDATALVHEAYLRLVQPSLADASGADKRVGARSVSERFAGRGHFFAAAAEAMRRILIDKARRKQCERHGGGHQRVAMLDVEAAVPATDEQLLLLDDALTRLAAIRPAAATVVQLRFFAGLTIEEAARTTGISSRTARRLWVFARAWLRGAMDARAGNS